MSGPTGGMMNLTIRDKAQLYATYMPFIREGGLFIPTSKKYQLGDEVFILLKLLDDAERLPVAGKVVWLTPAGAQGNKSAGIGIQFSGESRRARDRIETLLAGALKSDRSTYTM